MHGDGGEENGGDMVCAGGLLESLEVGLAGAEGVARLGQGGFEVLGDHIVHSEAGWAPATVLDATIEPIDATIGTARGGGVGCGG